MNKNKIAHTDKFFLKSLAVFFSYVNSKQIFPMLLLLGGGYVFTLLPSILGLIALFMLYGLAFKLAVDVLIETANGNMNPGDYQSSFDAKNIILQFVLVGLIQVGILIWLKYFVLDGLLIVAYILVSTFITPAVFMVLSITSSLTSALNPVIIFKLIKPWFFTYLVFVGFWLVIEIIQTYVVEPFCATLPSIFGGIIAHFVKFYFLILNFHIMGFLIYQHRESFGFEAKSDESPNDPNSSLGSEQSGDNPIHDRIRNLITMGNLRQAAAIIKELKEDGDKSQELEKLEVLLSSNNKFNEVENLTKAEQIHKLISDKKIGSAFQLYQQMNLAEEKYSEVEPEDVTSLAHYAFQSQKYSVLINILKFFHNKYPNHMDIVPNYFLIAQVLYQNDKTKEQAIIMLKKLIKKYPSHKQVPELISWLKGTELLNK